MKYRTIPQGHEFFNEDKTQGYRMAESLSTGQPIMSAHFIPIGDTEELKPGFEPPQWLRYALRDYDPEA